MILAQTHRSTDNIKQLALRASVIIVGYNSREDLARCLPSVIADCPLDVEVLVVDNASLDGTAEWLQAIYPQIKLLHSQQNLGFGGANNLAACHAQGEFLVFLNPDTKVEPGWLDALLAVFDVEEHVGMVTSKIVLMDDLERINTCGNDVHISGLTLCRGLGLDQREFSHLEEVGAVSGAAFAVRWAVFEALEGFDETYFMYMEDTDLSWRVRLGRWQIFYVPDSIVQHRYRLRFSPNKTYFQERNRYLMLLKCLRWPTLLVLTPALILAEIVTWGFVLTRDRQNITNKLAAYRWIIRHWSEIMAKRAQVQGQRKGKDRELVSQAVHRLDYAQTGGGFLPGLAGWIFDPLFYLTRGLALALIWW